MKISKELTEQAFTLFRKLWDREGECGFYTVRAKRLRQLADRANARYQRRLQAWWLMKDAQPSKTNWGIHFYGSSFG